MLRVEIRPPRGMALTASPTTMPYMIHESPGFRSTRASLCLAGMSSVTGQEPVAKVDDGSATQRCERDENVIARIELQNGFRHVFP